MTTTTTNQQLEDRAKEKAQEYLSKFSKETAIEKATYMRDVAAEYEDIDTICLWNKVLTILKETI